MKPMKRDTCVCVCVCAVPAMELLCLFLWPVLVMRLSVRLESLDIGGGLRLIAFISRSVYTVRKLTWIVSVREEGLETQTYRERPTYRDRQRKTETGIGRDRQRQTDRDREKLFAFLDEILT